MLSDQAMINNDRADDSMWVGRAGMVRCRPGHRDQAGARWSVGAGDMLLRTGGKLLAAK